VILAGVDEAGYGPLLGPLCVGRASFRVVAAPDAAAAEEAIRGAFGGPAGGVRVGDSKRIHRPGAGIGPLEREVLAVLAARDGGIPGDGRALLAALGAAAPPADHPWYAGLGDLPVPRAADGAEALARGRALAGRLRERGVELRDLAVDVLPEGRFNEAVGRLGNKAEVLFEGTARMFAVPLGDRRREPVEVLCDRQGGRIRYGALLRDRFPARPVRVESEGRAASAYAVGPGPAPARIRFEVRADASSPAVGLASMAAKYLREVHMEALNAWVLREAPGVRPTAGYWTDALRFLVETAPARALLGIDDRLFVRCR
jgi:hypothetical protein